jgi:hydrogenase maturation protein HypF
MLADGAILAIKGLGGFHLACDALNGQSVKRLRSLKRSSHKKGFASNKPFAVMAPNVAAVKGFAKITTPDREALESRARPIVLLDALSPNKISGAVAPNNKRFGVMLPYTPLHHLLFSPERDEGAILVMTSGNRSEEPIATSNEEALNRLSKIADAFLLHDRDIYMRADDSIIQVQEGKNRVLRRARGYAPRTIDFGAKMSEILACGPSLKNTFCLTKGSNAILSTHIGDLENYETLNFFKETLSNLKKSFRVSPEIIAHDLHPDYLSTSFANEYAKEHNIKFVFAVQHHHAHIAGCMAEHGLYKDVIGISFDGTGLGTDNNIWGGEFLIANRRTFDRKAHLKYIPMPGGEKAVTEPWRIALSYIHDAYALGSPAVIDKIFKRLDPKKREIIARMIETGINTPLTSSVGRLFDAVSSILGIRDSITFEAEAAIELESIADTSGTEAKEPYPFHITDTDPMMLDMGPLIKGVIEGLGGGVRASLISSRFHYTLGEVIVTVANRLRELTSIEEVVLSGGVFQNKLLLEIAVNALGKEGFSTFYNELVPTNDGGISLGQAVIAWENFKLKGQV